MSEIHLRSALEIRRAVASGEAKARDVVAATLERISVLNPKLASQFAKTLGWSKTDPAKIRNSAPY